jgi:hypothetical protein
MKILVVTQKPYFKNLLANTFTENENYDFDNLQAIFSTNDKAIKVSIAEDGAVSIGGVKMKHFDTLKLNFFKDTREKYVIETTDNKLDTDKYDYILFACDNYIKTFYSVMEYCERNSIPVDKILYKKLASFPSDSLNDIVVIDNTYHFADMTIDDFMFDE